MFYFFVSKLKAKSIMMNKANFIFFNIGKVFGFGAQFSLIWVMVSRFPVMSGWGMYEVLILWGFNQAAYALGACVTFGFCTNLSNLVKKGELDQILTRPVNSLFYLMSEYFSMTYLGNLVIAITALSIGFSNLHIHIGLRSILFIIITLIGGAMIHGSLFILSSIPTFWLTNSNAFRQLYSALGSFVVYPISIYNIAIQIVLTFIFPMAFVNFYPAHFLLNKTEPIMFDWLQYISLFVGIMLFALANKAWNIGIRRYDSTGS